MEKALLAPGYLATLCGVPLGTIYRWNNSGTGPPRIRLGKYVRYRQTDVDEWLEGRRTDGGAGASS